MGEIKIYIFIHDERH